MGGGRILGDKRFIFTNIIWSICIKARSRERPLCVCPAVPAFPWRWEWLSFTCTHNEVFSQRILATTSRWHSIPPTPGRVWWSRSLTEGHSAWERLSFHSFLVSSKALVISLVSRTNVVSSDRDARQKDMWMASISFYSFFGSYLRICLLTKNSIFCHKSLPLYCQEQAGGLSSSCILRYTSLGGRSGLGEVILGVWGVMMGRQWTWAGGKSTCAKGTFVLGWYSIVSSSRCYCCCSAQVGTERADGEVLNDDDDIYDDDNNKIRFITTTIVCRHSDEEGRKKKIIGNVNSALCHPARHDEVKVTRGAVASTAKGLYLCPRSPSYLRHTDVVLRYCTKVRVCSRSARRPRAKLG